MNIRNKTPEKMLVNVERLKQAISDDSTYKKIFLERDNSKNVALALLGALVSCLLTVCSSWDTLASFGRKAVAFSCFAFFVSMLWFIFKYIQANRRLKGLSEKDLNERIIDEMKDKIRYTALLIISYQKARTGEVKFMTEKQGNYLVHCDMAPYHSIDYQKECIINYLATSYNIQRNQIVSVNPLSTEPFFSIKPINGEETQNGFIFFQIKLKPKIKQNLLNHRNVSWKTIEEMEGMPELMGRNQDIVMALNDNKTKITDSFEDSNGPIHVIWNITKKCPYNCKICATSDDSRRELSTEEKLRVLDHIFSAKSYISTLDFAGGDPMYDSGTRHVVIQAINSMGEDRVSITTTGMGIEKIGEDTEEDIPKLLKQCEITIDASHENLSGDSTSSKFLRNSPGYCANNLDKVKTSSENLQKLVINIPLLDDDLSEDEINILLDKLVKLKQEYGEISMEAQIIRLMPVGAFNHNRDYAEKYENYNPIKLAEKIKERIDKEKIPCRLHCSLRVLAKLGACDKHCNMLERKIGIDCNGNVFACTWGAYLQSTDGNIANNPFYLGNLLSSSLKNILDGHNKTNAYKRIHRDISNLKVKPYCEVVSWFFEKRVDENYDPLAK